MKFNSHTGKSNGDKMNDQQRLLSGAIDNFLRLSPKEERWIIEQVKALPAEERDGIMEIITSWKEEGLQEGALAIITRLLKRRFGELSERVQKRISRLTFPQLEDLAEALLDFQQVAELNKWLDQQKKKKG